MTARCDSDPLDFATDVCQQCGGDFCDEHLVYPRGASRPPLCRRCAISAGGVRSGGAPARRRSRGEIKRRRAELRSQLGGPSRFATAGLPVDDVRAGADPDAPAVGPGDSDDAPRVPPATPAPGAATTLLTRLREGGLLGAGAGSPDEPDRRSQEPEVEARPLRTPGWVPAAAPRPMPMRGTPSPGAERDPWDGHTCPGRAAPEA